MQDLIINDKYRIVSDTYCFKLEKVRNRKSGQVWVMVGYYGRLKHALNGFVDHSMINSEEAISKDLKALYADLDKLTQLINRLPRDDWKC